MPAAAAMNQCLEHFDSALQALGQDTMQKAASYAVALLSNANLRQ